MEIVSAELQAAVQFSQNQLASWGDRWTRGFEGAGHLYKGKVCLALSGNLVVCPTDLYVFCCSYCADVVKTEAALVTRKENSDGRVKG